MIAQKIYVRINQHECESSSLTPVFKCFQNVNSYYSLSLIDGSTWSACTFKTAGHGFKCVTQRVTLLDSEQLRLSMH